MRTMLKSKIHRARVTDTNLYYEGSVTLDPVLMEAADLLPYEQVHLLDIDNGARLETYVIEGERGSGEVVVNGAAAHLIHRDDLVIIVSYVSASEEARSHKPRLVYVDEAGELIGANGIVGHEHQDAVLHGGLSLKIEWSCPRGHQHAHGVRKVG